MKSRFGVGLDWPIGYADLRASYGRIQQEVGISGDAQRRNPERYIWPLS